MNEIANIFKLVDGSFMGWISLRDGVYTPKAPFLAVKMFRNYFGPNLVKEPPIARANDQQPAVAI